MGPEDNLIRRHHLYLVEAGTSLKFIHQQALTTVHPPRPPSPARPPSARCPLRLRIPRLHRIIITTIIIDARRIRPGRCLAFTPTPAGDP